MNVTESEPNGTLSLANLISIGDTVTGTTSSASDQDLFKVVVSAPGIYEFDFASDAPASQWSFFVAAYDSAVNRIAGGGIGYGLGGTHTFVAPAAGTYYIQVSSNTSLVTTPYHFTLKAADVPLASYESGLNRSLATADTIAIDHAVTGELSIGQGSSFFKVSAATAGLLEFRFAPAASASFTTFDLNVYDAGGHIVRTTTARGATTLDVPALAQGTYTIEVKGHGTDSSPFSVQAHLDTVASIAPKALALGTQSNATLTAGASDWYSVTLAAGQFYEFNLLGADSGKGTLADPFLSLFDPNLVQVESQDNTTYYTSAFHTARDAQFGFVAPRSGTYYLRVDGKLGAGTYQLGALSDTSPALTQDVLELQKTPNYRWNPPASPGAAVSLTYSFLAAPADGYTAFSAMDTAERDAVRKVLALYAAVANLTFTEVAAPGGGQLRFGLTDLSGTGAGGITWTNTSAQETLTQADVYVDWTVTNYSAGAARGAFDTLLHEIGHALGMKHPGNYDTGPATQPGPFAPAAFDNRKWTVMAYPDDPDGATPATPGLIDIAAMQALYGVNRSQAGHSQVIAFDGTPVPLQGLIAAGAAITLDLSAVGAASTVNLAPGTFSSIGNTAAGQIAHDNVFIPLGAVVSRVVSSSAGDTILGTDADETVAGFAGPEWIDLAGGKNTLVLNATSADFNAARDSQLAHVQLVDLSGAVSAVTLDLRQQSEAIDVRASARNDVITLGPAGDTVYAGAGNATITGGAGADQVIFAGTRAAFLLQASQGAITVSDAAASSHVQSVTGVEHLRFSDMSVNAGIGQVAATIAPADLKTLEELYVAFFNREPDADGLSYWISQFHGGRTLSSIADGFYSAAVQYSDLTHYSDKMSQAEFVRVIYANVLGRTGATAPPDADVNYWAGRLASGSDTRGSLVGTMLTSAGTFKGDATWGWVPDLLDNKAAVANWLAVQEGITYNDPQASITKGMAIAAAVTSTDTHVAIALAGVGDPAFSLLV